MASTQPGNDEDRHHEEPAPSIEFSEDEPQNNAVLELPVDAQDHHQSNTHSQDTAAQDRAQTSTTTHPPTEAANQAANFTVSQRAGDAVNQDGNTRHTSPSIAHQSPGRDSRATQTIRSISALEGRAMEAVQQEIPPVNVSKNCGCQSGAALSVSTGSQPERLPFLSSTTTEGHPTSWLLRPVYDTLTEPANTCPKTEEELLNFLRNWTPTQGAAVATDTDRPQVSAVATSASVAQSRSHVSHAQQRSLPTNIQATKPAITGNATHPRDQTPLATDTSLASGFRNLLVLLSEPDASGVIDSPGLSSHYTPPQMEQVAVNISGSPARTSHERASGGGSVVINVPTPGPSRERHSDPQRRQQLQCPFNPRDFECLLCGFKARDVSGSQLPDIQIDLVSSNEEAISGILGREARLAGLMAELAALAADSSSDQGGQTLKRLNSIIHNLLSHLVIDFQQQPAPLQPTNVEQQPALLQLENVETPLQQATAAAIQNLLAAITEDIHSLAEPLQPVPVQLIPVPPVQLSATQASVNAAPVQLSSIPVQAVQAPVPIQSPSQLSPIQATPSQAALQLVPGQAPGQFSLQLAPHHSRPIAAGQPPSAQQTEATIDKLLRLVDSLSVVDLQPTSDSPRDPVSPLHSTPDRDIGPGLLHYTDISLPSAIHGGAENVISTEECMKCCYPPPPTRRRSRRDCDYSDRDPEPLLEAMYPVSPAEACSRCCSPQRRGRSRSQSPSAGTPQTSRPASTDTPVSPATGQRILQNLHLLLSMQEQYLLQSQPQVQNLTHSASSQNRTLLIRALQHLRQHDIEQMTEQQRAMQQSMLHLVLRELHDVLHQQRQRQQSRSPARSPPVPGVRRPATSPKSTPPSTPRPRPRVRFSENV